MARTSRLGALAVVLALSLVVPAQAGAKRNGVRFDLPAPGHISVGVLTITVKGSRGLPKRMRVLPQQLRRLPRSVRILYARRTIRHKRSTTYALALIAVNVARVQASQSQPPGTQPLEVHKVELDEIATMFLFFGGPLAADVWREQQIQQDIEDRWAIWYSMEAANADKLPDSTQTGRLEARVREVVDPNGDGKVDPGLDTGHYDDGHAFGWGIKSKAAEKKTWREIVNHSYHQWSQELEHRSNYDIDGDGTVEAPSSGGGQQIDTQTGTPVITGGGGT